MDRAKQPSLLGDLARAVVRLLATAAGACLLVFVAIEVSIPGGFRAVILPNGVDQASARDLAVVEEFHLDRPVVVRWGHWLVDLGQGDLGRSIQNGLPVTELIVPRLPISLQFVAVSVLGTVVLGIPLGLLAAARDGRPGGRLLNLLFGLSQSIPVFITPVFLIWLFALRLQWLPAAGWVRPSTSITGNLRTLALPATALILAEVGIVARLVRADVLRILESDVVATAMGKGLPRRYILARHALRPASLGVLNVVGLNIGSVLAGTVLVELIFGIGATGQLLLEASRNRDLYLLLALTLYMVTVYVVINTVVDVLIRVLDPRIGR
ncbi:MAG: ABC transporter permease [Actinomycetota bacterium]